MPKSAWTEKDQIDNFLKERRLMRSLEKIVGGRLYEDKMDSMHSTLSMYYDYDAHVKGELLVMMKNSQSVNLLIFISNTLIELFNDFGFDCDGIPKRPTMYLNLWSYKVVRHRLNTSAGNPVTEILLQLNLPDHRSILTDSKEYIKRDMEARGDDEVELTDEKSSDSEDEDEVAEIFRIETNVFDIETPLCRTFKEFNYLLQIDPDRDDGYCNGGNLPRTYIAGNTLRYQDFEWHKALKDGKLKEEALKNKAIMDEIIEGEDNESSNEGWRRCNVYENTNHGHEKREYEMEHENKERCELFDDHERPVCTIRRFEMIKYSFGQDEEYVAVKENEYDDSTSTSENACQTYQEIFRMMDEGWMVTRAE
ncbi:hypothetical protein Tco_1375388 [Tanacetum coccineum]